jgi:hypothetical protein
MSQSVLHTPETIFLIEATVSEDTSYYLHQNCLENFSFVYDNSKYYLDQVMSMINSFAVFHSKISLSEISRQRVSSRIPLEVFRYKLLSDGSWYYVKTIPSKHKDGKIVEGALWSNGMFSVTREKGTVVEASLHIDEYTKEFYSYP